jgi:hypothetical protein
MSATPEGYTGVWPGYGIYAFYFTDYFTQCHRKSRNVVKTLVRHFKYLLASRHWSSGIHIIFSFMWVMNPCHIFIFHLIRFSEELLTIMLISSDVTPGHLFGTDFSDYEFNFLHDAEIYYRDLLYLSIYTWVFVHARPTFKSFHFR